MKSSNGKVDLKTKMGFVLLTIGMFMLIWMMVTHEQVRRGYIYKGDIKATYAKVDEEVGAVRNLENKVVDCKNEEWLVDIISQELALSDANLQILSQNNYEESIIATFMYKSGEESYEGIVQVSQNREVLFKAVDKINKEEPFTLHEIEFRKENIPTFNVVYGVINTPIIKSVNINFNDATMVNIVLGENINYSYIRAVDASPIIRVEGVDDNFNVFYKWEKLYMKPV